VASDRLLSFRKVPLRKSTKIWLAIWAGAFLLALIDGEEDRLGPFLGTLAVLAFVAACLVLIAKFLTWAFRLIVRRLTLRLAFSYFLIGIVPIPLLAAMLFISGYIVFEQMIATRLRREVATFGEEARLTTDLPEVRVGPDGRVTVSEVDWLRPGEQATWVKDLKAPAPLMEKKRTWLAVPSPGASPAGASAGLLLLSDPKTGWLQRLADRSGYTLSVQSGTSRRRQGGIDIEVDPKSRDSRSDKKDPDPEFPEVRPRERPVSGTGFWDREWLAGLYLEKPVAIYGQEGPDEPVVVYVARTSPRFLFQQLFAQGMPDVATIMARVLLVIAGSLLVVYLIALAIAFILVGAITRNVNRLTRASQSIARGDFSARVNSKSRDQIGDLARSFDGMAASIQSLMVETAKKERLEGEIAVARTIQQKLLPPRRGELPGLELVAEFESVAEIGGDYYDYFRMPDGRSAVAIGDVSGHGLATGLLAAMAKAALSTLTEAGLASSPLFARLNELIHRSTDSRNYMTLAVLAYDAATRQGTLTNAGQLAPYRLGRAGLESLSLPSFPLGVSARNEFPSRTFAFDAGDRLLFFTDGFVEALSPSGEPFGFERLEEVLRRCTQATAEDLRGSLIAAVQEHAGGRDLEDDRTLVLLTVK
jgi:serine phosphatase RsbU (regulator of sigma subunit)